MIIARGAAIAAAPPASARLRIGRFVLAYVAVLRLYSVIPLALLAYAIGAAAGGPRGHLLAAVIAITCGLAGGYAYNDLRDRQCDRVNRPARPLVSGRLSVPRVHGLVVVLFSAAVIAAAVTGSSRTLVFAVLLVVSACAYSDVIKYIPAVKNVFVGVWCGVLPWGAALDTITLAALPSIALIMLFITQKELLADVYDRAGDAVAGVHTLPVIFGARASLVVVAAVNAGSWVVARTIDAPLLGHLPAAAGFAAAVNVIALLVVFWKPIAARAFLELQKIFMIGGCLSLFAALRW